MQNIITLILTLFCLTLVACKEKGPVEEAGDAFSDAAKKTGDVADKAYNTAKDAVNDGVDAVKEGAKKTGDAVEKAANDAKDAVTK